MYGIGYDEPKFKVGDRVRVVKDGWEDDRSCHGADIGDEDVITADADDAGRFEGEKWFYNPDEIELVEAPVPAPKFKVGQRVMVVRDGHSDGGSYHCAAICSVGKVVELVELDTEYYRRDDGWLFKEHELAPAFFPGDKVRVTEHSGYFSVGDIGEVEIQNDTTVFVKHGHYSRVGLPLDACALELVEAAEDEPKQKFKAGDVVGYNNGQKGCFTIRCLKTTYDDGSPFVGGGTAYDYVDGGWDFERSLTLLPSNGQQLASALSFERSCEDAALGIILPCIVARVVDGTPRPSNVPFVHPNAASATTEAERLAHNNPGQEFAVYQRVAGRMAEVSYSMKEVA